MAIQMLIFSVLASSLLTATSDKGVKPDFAFSWLDDRDTFQAGETAAIKIKVLGSFDSKGNASLEQTAFNPTLTVNGKMGNSSLVSGVLLFLPEDTNAWRILFTPITAGLYNVLITEDRFRVLDSSLHFQVEPAGIYPSVCLASWMGLANEFEAGTKATILVLPKDAFGNNVSSTSEELSSYNFTVSALYANGSIASMPNVTNMGWNEIGYIIVEFIVVKAGDLLLNIEGGNQTVNGSPLPFKVNPVMEVLNWPSPGPLDVSNCMAKWNLETNMWQIFSKMEIFIHQQDQYGNLVPGLYQFDADVVEKETNLSIPVSDLHFEEVMSGIQLFSFSLSEPGYFLLTISDMKHNKIIANMPYEYTVYVAYCDGSNSVVNGSGLNSSVSGEMANFSIYLNDIYQYPSPLEVEWLRVLIAREIDSYDVWSSIYPMQIMNGSGLAGRLSYGANNQTEIAPAPSVDRHNISSGSWKIKASAFNVIYMPQKSGLYDIRVFCGNILLNGGHSFRKEVLAGEVNISVSGVMKFAPKVARLVKNEIVVQLMDSFSNQVLSQQSRLKLEIANLNSSGFSSWMFADNNDGSYTVHYLAEDVGTYEMCVSFDGKRFTPCPFGINVYSIEYFPKAYDDAISIWEDESIAFDTLSNDYFAGDNASIVEFTKPGRGSLLQYGKLFRYTPYKDYYGNDSFQYTISDVNGNLATAAVNISVLSIPPQFVSFPSQLQATEDVISPRFGGFSGFELRYSDPMESVSVALGARSGTIFLSPMLMQFWQPMWSRLSVNKGDEEATDLILEGNVEVINFALQSIQYLGNENFYGEDTMRVSARNRNGKNDLDVPVFVESINDPPFIHVPEFIILKGNGDESLVFDRERDKFEFSIGDPDLINFPGGESHFLVTFSVEVNDGFLVTTLPAELINTTELKLKNSCRWQPLHTYVTISKHFSVKANGIRFKGSVKDCNSIMQQLLYHGEDRGAILTVTINDMGHYGCYPDCAEGMSMPLYVEATVNLLRRRPMSSLAAHTLGSAIIIESVAVFSLGMLLLFFTCKCAILLVNERRSHYIRTPELSRVQSSHKRNLREIFSENATYFTGCSSPLVLGGKSSNFRQRSCRKSRNGDSSKETYLSTDQSSSDRAEQSPLPRFVPLAIEKDQIEGV